MRLDHVLLLALMLGVCGLIGFFVLWFISKSAGGAFLLTIPFWF
jgi:hypothetical protein